eukprot:6388252-Lingulodinium_polyedra.AAC.1
MMRYIDDGVGIVKRHCIEQLFEQLNSWHCSIQVPRKDFAYGRKVHVLDVYIEADSYGVLSCSTYRKPVNIYDYVSPESARDPKLTTAIIRGECIRLFVTNTAESSYEEQRAFFKQRLIMRGYTPALIDKCFRGMPFGKRGAVREEMRSRAQRASCKRAKLFVLTKYVKGLEKVRMHRHLNKVTKYLNAILPDQHIAVCAGLKVGRNLFRAIYKFTW